jgi:high-affinity iron transporter
MLATLVIGLREGLEAALIVGIIAAFLRSNGRSLVPMWIGVALAVALSLAVGIGLALVEGALPQAAQEGLETVIGAVAVFFVAGMIVWMTGHARGMKAQLEHEAADALDRGGRYALAIMAFLAVLKEGFETAVFLLATFSASQNAALAALGAITGITISIGVGIGIYVGGVHINLARFFRVTGAFLILVAAGLVLSTLRTAHEAGWLNAGQQKVADLSWLVAPGSVQSALITGVLGIPADPRLIEVVGWLAFLVTMALFVYWPASRRATGPSKARLQLGLGAGLLVSGFALAVLIPVPQVTVSSSAPLVVGADLADASSPAVGTATLDAAGVTVSIDGREPDVVALPAADAQRADRNAVALQTWTVTSDVAPESATPTLTIDELLALGDGRLPAGVNARQNPGPFDARWTGRVTTQVWAAEGSLVDLRQQATAVVTLTGGGLGSPRTITVDSAQSNVVAAPAHANEAIDAIVETQAARSEHGLWARAVPAALAFAGLALLVFGFRTRAATRRGAAAPAAASPRAAATVS